MISFNYIVFYMFRQTKFSSSGRLLHAVLWHFFHAAVQNCMYKSFWGWTLGCSKHVEDNIIELRH